MIGQLLWVGLGGFLGAIARYGASHGVHRWLPLTFPYGTLLVNLTGCLGIGLIAGILGQRHSFPPFLRPLLMVGFLGGFTTYSTFAWETLRLGQAQEFAAAAANVLLHVSLGLVAAWLGLYIAQRL